MLFSFITVTIPVVLCSVNPLLLLYTSNNKKFLGLSLFCMKSNRVTPGSLILFLQFDKVAAINAASPPSTTSTSTVTVSIDELASASPTLAVYLGDESVLYHQLEEKKGEEHNKTKGGRIY